MIKIKRCANCENEIYSFEKRESKCKETGEVIEDINNYCDKYREFISYDRCLK